MRTGILLFLLYAATVNGQEWGTGILEPASRPMLVKSVKASYTPEAKAAQLQGWVGLTAVVLSDGKMADVKVITSCVGRIGAQREPNGDPFPCRRVDQKNNTIKLDPSLGLDQQAVTAVRQWMFRPGTKNGKPVAVPIFIRINFDLRDISSSG